MEGILPPLYPQEGTAPSTLGRVRHPLYPREGTAPALPSGGYGTLSTLGRVRHRLYPLLGSLQYPPPTLVMEMTTPNKKRSLALSHQTSKTQSIRVTADWRRSAVRFLLWRI